MLRRQPLAWLPWLRVGGRGNLLALHDHPLHRQAPPGSWVLLPELMYQGLGQRLVEYVHRRRWRLAAIFYDTIPVDRPDLVPPELPANHARYIRDLSGADLILPISETSAEGWRAFVAGGRVAGGRVLANWPGLSSGNLFENRDLQPTADLRSVAKGLLLSHLGLPPAALAAIFPDSTEAAPTLGLLRA